MKTIQDFFNLYKQTAWEKDTEQMITLYHKDVVIFDMWEHGYQTGLGAWSVVIKDWLGSLGDEKVKVLFEMIASQEDGNIGFGTALISYQAIAPDNSILRSMKNRITLGFSKVEGNWKVIHQHTSAPLNGDLQGILDF